MNDIVAVTLFAGVMHALAAGINSTIVYVLVAVKRPENRFVLGKPGRVRLLASVLVRIFLDEFFADLDQFLFDRQAVGLPRLRLRFLAKRVA
jgi:hypothetical protein